MNKNENNEDDFQYNKETKVLFKTKKLDNGFIARIYFSQFDFNYFQDNHRVYYVSMAISRSKKYLNNWIYATGGNTDIDTESQYIGFGLSVILWAKQCVYQFLEKNHVCVFVTASNAKRYKVYKWGLKDFKESSAKIDNIHQKFLYKTSTEYQNEKNSRTNLS